MKILLTGGGTLGSVSPLLAVLPQLQKDGHEVRFIGTRDGPEQELVEAAGVSFSSIATAKLRRYFSGWNLLTPFQFAIAIFQACIKLLAWRPDLIVSAGGFVSVPLVWAGRIFGVPSIIHQQDLEPGLANKLMVSSASKITVAFEDSLKDFPAAKTAWTGNPVRDLTSTTNEFELDSDFPTVFITGGGTGAQAINDLVSDKLCEFANVIHLIGKGKTATKINHQRYHGREFLVDEMMEAYEKADLVVARGGLGTISELAALGKAAIIIPLPDTHQEKNAAFLAKHQAAIVLDQTELTPEEFGERIKKLLADPEQRAELEKTDQILSQGKRDRIILQSDI